MKIEQMFAKPIDRPLKGVIKVGQNEDAEVQQELEEYVVTRELQKHFRDFFEGYRHGIVGTTDRIGIWISGFFGCGKSNLLKIVAYILGNRKVNGKTALQYFEEEGKIKDQMVLADMKLAASVPTDVILFNIDSKGEQSKKQDEGTIVYVFLKVFNEMLGFSESMPYLADLERKLSEEGRYEEFKQLYKDTFGTEWTEDRNDFDFIQDNVVDVLTTMGFMSEAAARNWCEKATTEYSISIENFAKMVKKYLDSKEANHHIVFLVDEIGQYIGDNSKLMLGLQTLTEDLGRICQGKAWIVVTSQQDIESITQAAGKESTINTDFSKIQGRFDTRLSLSSSNVDEVIRERILKKTPTAAQTLSLYFDEKDTTIKNLILFNNTEAEMKLYSSRSNFADVYPFVPYQFNLLGSVLTKIRTYGASGKHLAEGERSMLALFKESAMSVKTQETGSLVPFNMFYDALEQFLDHSHKGVIDRAMDNEHLNPDHSEDCFAVNVLKTLFMIKYVKEIKPNVNNITNLMVSHVDEDRMTLTKKVEDALDRLVRETLVQKNGDHYEFLTNEEQEINRAIKRQPIDTDDVMARVSELVFDDLLDDKKYRYPAFGGNRYAFGFNQVVDDRPHKGNQNYDITLRILTPNSDDMGDSYALKHLSAQTCCVLVVLPPDRAFLDEIYSAIQIDRFIRYDADMMEKYQTVKDNKKTELANHNSAARAFLEEALKEAIIYVNGDVAQSSARDIKTRINEALGRLVSAVYHKLPYIDTKVDDSEIRKVLTQTPNQLTLDGKDDKPSNSLALSDMKDFIGTNTSRHIKTSMKSLLDRFTKAPYGFIEVDVQWLVAKLFRDGDIALYVNSEPVTLLSHRVDEIVRFITRKEYTERLMTESRIRASEKQKKIVRDVAKDLFGTSLIDNEDDAVMDGFMRGVRHLKTDLEMQEIRYQNQPKYPGKDVVKEGKQLMNDLLQLKTTTEFFNTVTSREGDLLEFAEDYEPVKTFFNGKEQLSIFDKAIMLMGIYEQSRTFIVDEKIESTARDINAILRMDKPYGEIYRLPGLLEEYSNAYADLLDEMAGPVLDAVADARGRVFTELKGKLCENVLSADYADRFEALEKKTKSCNNIALLQSVKAEADALKVRCINSIAAKEAKMQAEKAAEESNNQQPKDNGNTDTGKDSGGTTTVTNTPPIIIKNRRAVSIKSINKQATWQIETPEDVKRYVAELEKNLIAQLEDNTIINIEF